MERIGTENPCFECELKCGIFKYLTEFELELVTKNRYGVIFKPGEVILKQGTAVTHVVAFLDGLAKLYIEGYYNRDLILKIQKSKEIIASPGMYVDYRHHFSLAALTNCITCMIDLNVFKQLVRQNSAFMEAFIAEFSTRTIYNFKKFTSLTQKQMHGRMADTLINLAEDIFNSNTFNVVMSRQDLADMTSMTKESASRILQQFKSDGIINVKGNFIEILNISQLRNISATG